MADKITNIEDYRKRDVKQENKEIPPNKEETAPMVVRQETMEIEIEDPYQFLNAHPRSGNGKNLQKVRKNIPQEKKRKGLREGKKLQEEKSLQDL